MPELSRAQVETAIKGYFDPYLQTDLVSAKAIKEIGSDAGKVSATVVLGFPARPATRSSPWLRKYRSVARLS